MRTTLDIEVSILKDLKERAHQEGTPIKKLVNAALKKGLEEISRPKARRAFRVHARSLGKPLPPFTNLDKALQIADMLGDEEILRKMSLGK